MAEPDLRIIHRWEAAGGICNIAAITPDGVTVTLVSCGGEEMDRFTSRDPQVHAWAEAHAKS